MRRQTNHNLIFMAGGGTAGHVYPNLALVPALKKAGVEVAYLGRNKGYEHELLKDTGIPFYNVNSERFNRFFTWETLATPFKVIQGIFQTVHWIHKYRPALVFCKGGFGSVPAAVGGWLACTPVILHEADMTPGMANKMCMPFAKKVCVTFESTLAYTKGKGIYTGVPIRESLTQGSREKGLAFAHLKEDGRPIVMVVGGSTGAKGLNHVIQENLPELLRRYQLIHLFGSGQEEDPPVSDPESGYFMEPYAKEELADLFAASDIVISRAGSNAINELLLLKKPNILVPLPTAGSRGDQLLNAEYFRQKGFSEVILQEDLTGPLLISRIDSVLKDKGRYITAMGSDKARNGIAEVTKVILQYRK